MLSEALFKKACHVQQPTEKQQPRAQEINTDASTQAPAEFAVAPAQSDPPGALATTAGTFAYNHRNFFTHNPIGNTAYQFIRSAVASVPYGIGASAVWTAKNMALQNVEKGSHLESLLKSPLLFAAQIAASFTFYRTGSFTMRRMYERVLDNDNSREDTIKEAAEIPKNFFNDFRSNLAVQASSVPWAALTLGYIASLGPKPSAAAMSEAEHAPGAILFRKDANWLRQAGTNTIAYGTFFEIADQLAKQFRWQRGIPDPTLPISKQTDERGHTVFQFDDPNKHFGFFTNDTGIGRLALRRMLPVAVGIGAYTGAKRLGYRYSLPPGKAETFFKEGADGAAKVFGLDPNPKGTFLMNAWREGAATSLFFLYPMVKDPWEHVYDEFFEKLENKAREKESRPPMPHVQPEGRQRDGTIDDKTPLRTAPSV